MCSVRDKAESCCTHTHNLNSERAVRLLKHQRWTFVTCSRAPGCWDYRISEQACAGIGSKVLKQRVHTVAKATEVCMAFVELEQGEVMMVQSHPRSRPAGGCAAISHRNGCAQQHSGRAVLLLADSRRCGVSGPELPAMKHRCTQVSNHAGHRSRHRGVH